MGRFGVPEITFRRSNGRWQNDPDQIGHGYRLDLTDFACGWLPLCKRRKATGLAGSPTKNHRRRRFWSATVQADRPLAATPSGKPEGDTTIQAKLGNHLCAEAPVVVVVVPKRIRPPYPEADGDVQSENVALYQGSSPAFQSVPQGAVLLSTIYVHWLPITVEDQFQKPLDDLYAGVTVEEKLGLADRDINQKLDSSGGYRDPVGWYIEKGRAAKLSDEESQWTGSTNYLPMPAVDFRQDIPVKVAGHEVGPIKRRIILTPPRKVEIIWR